jgi:hypothetical protein
MSLGIAFWVIMIVWVIFGLAVHGGYIGQYSSIGGMLLLVALFGLLGWKVFGPVLHG